MSQDQDDDRTIIRPAGSPPGGTAAPAPPAAMASGDHDHHNALPLGTYLGEFELQGVIGEGGFGIVYLAWDHSLQRRVALKEYFPSSLAARAGGHTVAVKSPRHRETFQAGLSSFVNEARLLAQFDHASLVKVYRFWEANDTAYMVMPFYEGETLKDTLRDLGAPPDEAWLMGVLAPLTEALEVIHTEQCYHRDIAPDNVILLKGSKRPLLLDFGAARRVIGDMTQALTVILKPGYAPVEQYAEVPGMKQGPWTDVYALAALIYNAITGKTPPTSVGRLMNDNYQPLAEVAQGRYSDRFLQAVDRALKVKPDDRTPNIGALRADLGMDQSPALDSQRTVMPGAAPSASQSSPPTVARPSAHTPTPAPVAQAASAGAVAPPVTAPAASAAPASRTGLYAALGLGTVALVGGAAWWLLGGPPAASNATTMAQGATAPQAVLSPAASATTPVAQAPSAPVVAALAVPAPNLNGPFQPVDEFKRIMALADASFQVEAMPSKPQFRIGKDRLGFKVSAAQDGYVYVMLQSTDGAFMRLFPNTIGKDNRIKAGQILVLPQASWPMDTAGPAGTDHFLVMVSEHPRDFVQAGMKMDGGFGEYPVGEAALALLRQHPTGPSPFAGRPQCPQGDACPDVYGAAMFSSEEIE